MLLTQEKYNILVFCCQVSLMENVQNFFSKRSRGIDPPGRKKAALFVKKPEFQGYIGIKPLQKS